MRLVIEIPDACAEQAEGMIRKVTERQLAPRGEVVRISALEDPQECWLAARIMGIFVTDAPPPP